MRNTKVPEFDVLLIEPYSERSYKINDLICGIPTPWYWKSYFQVWAAAMCSNRINKLWKTQRESERESFYWCPKGNCSVVARWGWVM